MCIAFRILACLRELLSTHQLVVDIFILFACICLLASLHTFEFLSYRVGIIVGFLAEPVRLFVGVVVNTWDTIAL
jgi:hypothetical protein